MSDLEPKGGFSAAISCTDDAVLEVTFVWASTVFELSIVTVNANWRVRKRSIDSARIEDQRHKAGRGSFEIVDACLSFYAFGTQRRASMKFQTFRAISRQPRYGNLTTVGEYVLCVGIQKVRSSPALSNI